MPERSAIPGLKRLPKPGGRFTWYWVASQISTRAGDFRPKTARLWHGVGAPNEQELEQIRQQAHRLSVDLREWLLGRRKTPHRGKRGTIYFIRAGERVKIGFTQNMDRRLSQLQLFFPERLEVVLTLPGSILMEHELHRRFAAHELEREWFAYAAPIAAFVGQENNAASVRTFGHQNLFVASESQIGAP